MDDLSPYVYNDRLHVIHGGEYIAEGILSFPTAINPKLDGSYRSLFGPCAAHNGLIYANSDENTMAAIQARILALVPPPHFERDTPIDDQIRTYDRQLEFNQTAWFGGFEKETSRSLAMSKDFEKWETYVSRLDEIKVRVHDPHPKKRLRLDAFSSLMECDYQSTYLDRLWVKRLWIKEKSDEIAKPGKPPRCIADLGVKASLQGFLPTKRMKHWSAEHPLRLESDGRTAIIRFVETPDFAELTSVFRNLMNPPCDFYFVYFSDDACVSIRTPLGVARFNLDIRKCDRSHRPAIFEALIRTAPWQIREEIKKLVEQCALPIHIRSRTHRGVSILAEMTNSDGTPRVFLPSGSTITTLINNLANENLGRALFTVDPRVIDGSRASLRTLQEKCEEVGYSVSGFEDPWKVYHQLQFLKHSPAFSEGPDGFGLYPLLNPGVLIRAIGTCKGDLPGSRNLPIEVRAKQMNAGILNGMYPRVQCPFLNSMRDNFGQTSAAVVKRLEREMRYKSYLVTDSQELLLTDREFFRRYGLDQADLSDAREFANAGFGYRSAAPFVGKLLKLDYGLDRLLHGYA